MKWIYIFVIVCATAAFTSCESTEEEGVPHEFIPINPPIMSQDSDEAPPAKDSFEDGYNPKTCELKPEPTLKEFDEYLAWTDKFDKQYKKGDERKCKFIRVVHHIREVNAHNKLFEEGKVSYKRDLTPYSDLSHDEKFEKLIMHDVPYQAQARQANKALPILPPARDSVDYVKEGLVAPVGSQQKCGSCYGWSGAAALEGQLRKCGISNESVSVQTMVDCPAIGCLGCRSGWPYWAYKWQMSGGIHPDSKYPYKDKSQQCAYNASDIIAYVQTPYKWDFTTVNGNASFIKQVVSAYGPVATIICVDKSLFQYKSGVYKIDNCCNAIQHAVAIVGYGTDPQFGDYWLIKNSWGTGWGMNGFAKIARGINLCISETQIQYAQVRDVNGKVCPTYT